MDRRTDRKARLAVKHRRELVAHLRKYAERITGDRRELALQGARLAVIGVEPGQDGWPPRDLLEKLEVALDGVELEDDGAADEASALLRQCAERLEASLRDSPPRP